jgi:hypothetical protein
MAGDYLPEPYPGYHATVTIGDVTIPVTSWGFTVRPRRVETATRPVDVWRPASVSITVVWNPPPSRWWDLIGGWYKGRPGFCLADALRPSRN